MKRFKNILAIYDDKIGADDVLSHAVRLAKSNNASLSVIDPLPERFTGQAEISERRKRLLRLIPAIKAEGIAQVRADVVVGTPFMEIIRQVLQAEHDLVIASADGGATLRNVYFGSTATHLMRKCPCPVWVVKPQKNATYAKILACIDPRSSNPDENEMDIKILDLSTSLATAFDAELHIVHAWDVEGKDRDTVASETPDETIKAILSKHELRHRLRIEALLTKYPMAQINHQLHLPRGRPQKEIVGLVDQLGIDLTVMGTVARSGISGFLMGNAAEDVLSAVECGMFTVKPKGFETPVLPRLEMAVA